MSSTINRVNENSSHGGELISHPMFPPCEFSRLMSRWTCPQPPDNKTLSTFPSLLWCSGCLMSWPLSEGARSGKDTVGPKGRIFHSPLLAVTFTTQRLDPTTVLCIPKKFSLDQNFIWMQRLSRSLSRLETQDIKTQPQINHYLKALDLGDG